MATSETNVRNDPESNTAAEVVVKPSPRKEVSIVDKILALLSSVRFGVTMLVILLICCMIGMLIQQVNVEGFQEYFQRLTPAQRLIYSKLGFFDIYRSWYFSLLLAVTGLNIILASIDRFPTAWLYISKPKVKASPNFIRAQMFNSEIKENIPPQKVAESVRAGWRRLGFRGKATEDGKRITVFAQKNTWNRLGAYAVHVALLTIFTGGFLTNRYGVGGMMEIRPGMTTNAFNTIEESLDGPKVDRAFTPFQVECVDLQQKLIRPEGGLDAQNTIDWISTVKIKDGSKEVPAVVKLNYPFDYRGYRLFQSQFTPVGNARKIVLSFEPASGGSPLPEVTIPRNGSEDVPGIGKVSYVDFFPDFKITESGPTTQSGEYNSPAARLEITSLDGKKQTAFAFSPKIADEYLSAAEKADKTGGENPLLVNGYKVILKDFEKVALGHTLAVQYDPGRIPVYTGFTLLILALCGVFFFSHQRAWAVIEPDPDGGSTVYFGGNTNRNRPAFEARFNSLVQSVSEGRSQR